MGSRYGAVRCCAEPVHRRRAPRGASLGAAERPKRAAHIFFRHGRTPCRERQAVRLFELTTRINAVQRSQGDSATAKAAYRACCVIECEREGKTHDYSRKQGHEASGMDQPEDGPAWGRDRAKLWNAAELVEKNGKRGPTAGQFRANAQTARDLLFTFPSELSQAGRLNTARIIAGFLVSTSSVAVDFSIHKPGKDGDERNHHCHMMFTTRRMTANGSRRKNPRVGRPQNRAEALKGPAKIHCRHVERRTGNRGQGRDCPRRISQFQGPGQPAETHTAASGAGQNPRAAQEAGAGPQGMGGPAAPGAA